MLQQALGLGCCCCCCCFCHVCQLVTDDHFHNWCNTETVFKYWEPVLYYSENAALRKLAKYANFCHCVKHYAFFKAFPVIQSSSAPRTHISISDSFRVSPAQTRVFSCLSRIYSSHANCWRVDEQSRFQSFLLLANTDFIFRTFAVCLFSISIVGLLSSWCCINAFPHWPRRARPDSLPSELEDPAQPRSRGGKGRFLFTLM